MTGCSISLLRIYITSKDQLIPFKHFQVYDYDVSSGDDYLGEALLPLPLPGEVVVTMMIFGIALMIMMILMMT